MIFIASACQPVSFFAQSSTFVPFSGLTLGTLRAGRARELFALAFFFAGAFFFLAAGFFAALFFLAAGFFAALFFLVAMPSRVEGRRAGSSLDAYDAARCVRTMCGTSCIERFDLRSASI